MHSKSKKANKSKPKSRKTISASATTDIQSTAVLNQLLAFAPNVHPRLKAEDKTPNGDGYVDITNAEGQVEGVLEIQVKTLRKGLRKLSCPTYLVDYAEHNALPFLIIGVDRNERVAYWKQLSSSMHGYKPEQASFTIRFDHDDLIDDTHRFCEPWRQIAKARANLPNEFKQLVKAVSIDENDNVIQMLQEFIGVINGEFDIHWAEIKRQFFPTLWKFGVLLIHYEETPPSWVYQVYSIPNGVNAPLVMAGQEIDPLQSAPDSFGRIAFATHFSRSFCPESCAFNFVESLVIEALKVGYFRPVSEACLVEHAWAAFRAFPNLKGVVKNRELYLQILLDRLSHVDLNSLGIPELYLEDAEAIRQNGIYSSQRLLALGYRTIENPYIGRGCPVAMYEGQKQANLITNLRRLLKQLLPEYQVFLGTYGLEFLGTHWFDQSLSVCFVIKPRKNGTINYDEYFVDYTGTGSRVRIVGPGKIDSKDYQKTRHVFINGKSSRVHCMKIRTAPTQIFSYTPLGDIILQMLESDVRDYFKNSKLP